MKPLLAFVLSLLGSLHIVNQPTPTPAPYVPFSVAKPPRESLRGELTTLSGDVLWQSRTATEGAKITTSQAILQGEALSTGSKGAASIEFNGAASMSLSSESAISFIQTLPANIVINQTSGTVAYTRSGTVPLSIRVLGLLLNVDEGEIMVAVNPLRPIITVEVKKGIVTAGFNDLYLVSNVVNISQGHIFYFNNETRKTDLK